MTLHGTYLQSVQIESPDGCPFESIDKIREVLSEAIYLKIGRYFSPDRIIFLVLGNPVDDLNTILSYISRCQKCTFVVLGSTKEEWS